MEEKEGKKNMRDNTLYSMCVYCIKKKISNYKRYKIP